MEGMGMNPLMFLLNGQWHLVVVMPPMEKGRSCGVKPAQELGAFTEIFISVDLCIYIYNHDRLLRICPISTLRVWTGKKNT